MQRISLNFKSLPTTINTAFIATFAINFHTFAFNYLTLGFGNSKNNLTLAPAVGEKKFYSSSAHSVSLVKVRYFFNNSLFSCLQSHILYLKL